MIKLDPLTLEPRFIDRNICFCFGGGDTSGGQTTGMSPGRSQAEFGTAEFGGMTQGEAEAAIGSGEASQQAQDVQANLGRLEGLQAAEQARQAQQQAEDDQKAIARAFVTDTKGKPVGAPNSKTGYATRGFDPVTGRAPTAAEKADIVSAGLAALGRQTAAAEAAQSGSALGKAATAESEFVDPVTGITDLSAVPDQFTSPATSNIGQTTAESINAEDILGFPGELSTPTNTATAVAEALAADIAQQAEQRTAERAAQQAETLDAIQSNIESAIAAKAGTPTQASPSIGSPFGQDVTTESLQAAQDNLSARAGLATEATTDAPADVGIASSPSVSAADVLGMPDELGFTQGTSGLAAPATSTTTPGQLDATEMAALDALAARGFEDETAEMGLRASDLTPGQIEANARANIGYDDVGLPRGLETVTAPSGAEITTNLAGLTRTQAENQPLSMDIAQFIGSNPYGYEIDPATGQVVGQVGTPGFGMLGSATSFLQDMFLDPPQTTEDLIERGMYTGMTGQGGDGMMGGDGSADQPVQQPATTDPCPDGYALIDGACTPVSAEEEAAFKFGTDTGVRYFDPFTQATQIGGQNPFVLQPYRPGQNPFAQPTQAPASTGIQGLSPTGAALGRSI